MGGGAEEKENWIMKRGTGGGKFESRLQFYKQLQRPRDTGARDYKLHITRNRAALSVRTLMSISITD